MFLRFYFFYGGYKLKEVKYLLCSFKKLKQALYQIIII